MKRIQSMEEFSPEARTAIESRKVECSCEHRIGMVALRLLQHDLSPEKKIRGRMQLSGPDPWCEVRLPMVDGSTAVLNGHEYRTGWYKTCSVTASLIPDRDKERVDSNREKAEAVDRGGLRVGRIERWWKFKGQTSEAKS